MSAVKRCAVCDSRVARNSPLQMSAVKTCALCAKWEAGTKYAKCCKHDPDGRSRRPEVV